MWRPSIASCTCSTWTCRAGSLIASPPRLSPGSDVVVTEAHVRFGARGDAVDSTTPAATPVAPAATTLKLAPAICYDLRFPELFRLFADRGAEIVALPAAFTKTTGRDHWELLCRARAVENQCYLAAANQTGTHATLETYGHSLIVDPWGTVLHRPTKACSGRARAVFRHAAGRGSWRSFRRCGIAARYKIFSLRRDENFPLRRCGTPRKSERSERAKNCKLFSCAFAP